MKVCLIAEGCYPYVVGGVSSWVHSMIQSFPDVEFSLVAILAGRAQRGKFAYDLPANLTEVYEVYLQDQDWSSADHGADSDRLRWARLDNLQYSAFHSLVLGEDVDWLGVFDLSQGRGLSVNDLLMSPSFLEVVRDYYHSSHKEVPFTDFLWTMRSIYLPLLVTLQFTPPEADIYHCVSTGYAGIIGSLAKHLYPKAGLLISEHGIYTREREEEIIKARWVQGIYKDIWIAQFRKMSQCAYQYADKVTSLFASARELQLELGCPEGKTVITPNGIDLRVFENAPQKDAEDPFIHVGAVVRVTPIKDVKTMITAFHFARQREPRLKLWLMGPEDEDDQYAAECHRLIDILHAEHIVFTGRIQTADYIGKMDMTILTSISEGQPLTILESFAVKKPVIATNVGNCYGLINGEDHDGLGAAGIVVPVMNISTIADAILTLAEDENLRRRMGEIGYRRLNDKYLISYMKRQYRDLYNELAPSGGQKWQE